jgi:hypothetical protein
VPTRRERTVIVMTMTDNTTHLPTLTAPRAPTAAGLPQPRRGACWRWSTPPPARGGTRPSGVLAVTRAIARHRYHLRR